MKLLLLDQSTVKFAPSAFLDSNRYLDTDETLEDLAAYDDIILNGASNNIFRVSIIKSGRSYD